MNTLITANNKPLSYDILVKDFNLVELPTHLEISNVEYRQGDVFGVWCRKGVDLSKYNIDNIEEILPALQRYDQAQLDNNNTRLIHTGEGPSHAHALVNHRGYADPNTSIKIVLRENPKRFGLVTIAVLLKEPHVLIHYDKDTAKMIKDEVEHKPIGIPAGLHVMSTQRVHDYNRQSIFPVVD